MFLHAPRSFDADADAVTDCCFPSKSEAQATTDIGGNFPMYARPGRQVQ